MWFDLVILSIMSSSSLISFSRGFTREFLGLCGIIAVIFLTINYHGIVAGDLEEYFSKQIASILSSAFVSVVLLIFFSITASILSSLFNPVKFKMIDKFGGFIIGATKGMVFSYLLFVLIQFFYLTTFSLSPTLTDKFFHHSNSDKKAKDKKQQTTREDKMPDWLKNAYSYPVLKTLESSVMTSLTDSTKQKLKEMLGKYIHKNK